jgi:molybdopterin converting factor small subunit
LNLEGPLTVQDVTALLGLDPAEVGLIVINGVQSEMEDRVPPDCRLCFFPPVSGGS